MPHMQFRCVIGACALLALTGVTRADITFSDTEFANAKSYLTGSFALRFDSNSKIASQLLWMLQEEMGIDYVEKRNALVDAVTLDDVKRVAKRLLTSDDLIITVVGKPKGLGQKR